MLGKSLLIRQILSVMDVGKTGGPKQQQCLSREDWRAQTAAVPIYRLVGVTAGGIPAAQTDKHLTNSMLTEGFIAHSLLVPSMFNDIAAALHMYHKQNTI